MDYEQFAKMVDQACGGAGSTQPGSGLAVEASAPLRDHLLSLADPAKRAEVTGALAAEIDTAFRQTYRPCGGCGADHPGKRCIGCFHDFGGDDEFSLHLREREARREAERKDAERAAMTLLTAEQRRALGLPDFDID